MRIGAIVSIFIITILCSIAHGETPYTFPVQPLKTASFSRGGHGYPGIDIFSRKNTYFVAPTSGTVEDVQRDDLWDKKTNDSEKKGGRWVSIIGDDGYRYYGSHLEKVSDDIFLGKKIKPGDILGYIGSSGNAKGTANHLHFGISLASRPYTWKVRRGEIEPSFFLKCLHGNTCDPRKTLEKTVNKGVANNSSAKIK